MYYRPCPYCGANNDPGEHCDCRDEQPIRKEGEKSAAIIREDARRFHIPTGLHNRSAPYIRRLPLGVYRHT